MQKLGVGFAREWLACQWLAQQYMPALEEAGFRLVIRETVTGMQVGVERPVRNQAAGRSPERTASESGAELAMRRPAPAAPRLASAPPVQVTWRLVCDLRLYHR